MTQPTQLDVRDRLRLAELAAAKARQVREQINDLAMEALDGLDEIIEKLEAGKEDDDGA